MSPFSKWLFNFFRRQSANRASVRVRPAARSAPPRTVRLHLEQLEDRTMPSTATVPFGTASTALALVDPNSSLTIAAIVSQPQHGTITTDPSTGMPDYTQTDLAFSGVDSFTVQLSDGTTAVENVQIQDAPTVTTLTASASSVVAGASLTFTATVAGANANATAGMPAVSGGVAFKEGDNYLAIVPLDSTGAASYTTSSLAIGDHSITAEYVGSTPYAGSASNALTVTVADPTPTIQAIADPVSLEGDAIALPVQATDPSGLALTYSLANATAGLSIDQNGLISGTIQAGASTGGDFGDGVYTATVTASDGTYSASQDFVWTVNPRIAIAAVADQTNIEGDSVSLPAIATTPDNTAISFVVTGLPTGLTFDPTANAIVGSIAAGASTGGDNQDGFYTTTITASDGTYSTSQQFVWTVNPRIAITAVADETNIEGDSVNLPVLATTPDNTALTWSSVNLPVGLSIDGNGLISGTIQAGASTGGDLGDGVYTATITASDGTYTASQDIVWTVNPRVAIATVADQTNLEGDTVNLPVIATTPDGTTLTYSLANAPAGLSIDQNGLISGTIQAAASTAGDNQDGIYTATVTATDGTYSASQEFDWTVNPRIAIASIADQTNIEGDSVNLSVNATTPDNTALSYTVDQLPPGLSMNSGGLISGTIQPGAATGGDNGDGFYSTIITATDGTYSATTQINWYVSARITLAVVDAQQNVIDTADNIEGDAISFQAQASTPDNTALTYGLANAPAGISIDPVSGVISGSIAAGDSTGGTNGDGVYTATVTASDGTYSATTTINWRVWSTAPYIGIVALPADAGSNALGQFLLVRSGDTSNPLTISYTVGGTAIPDDGTGSGDYQPLSGSGSITFAAGQDTATIAINPTSAGQFTDGRTVIVTLAASSDGSYAVDADIASATVTLAHQAATTTTTTTTTSLTAQQLEQYLLTTILIGGAPEQKPEMGANTGRRAALVGEIEDLSRRLVKLNSTDAAERTMLSQRARLMVELASLDNGLMKEIEKKLDDSKTNLRTGSPFSFEERLYLAALSARYKDLNARFCENWESLSECENVERRRLSGFQTKMAANGASLDGRWMGFPSAEAQETTWRMQLRATLGGGVGIDKDKGDPFINPDFLADSRIRFSRGAANGVVKLAEGVVYVVIHPDDAAMAIAALVTDENARRRVYDQIRERLKDDRAENVGELFIEIPATAIGGIGAVKVVVQVTKLATKGTIKILKGAGTKPAAVFDEMARRKSGSGKPYSEAEIKSLDKDLRSFSDGTASVKQDPTFIAEYNRTRGRNAGALFDPKTGTIYLGEGATYSDFVHEFFHLKQWMEVGADAYKALSTIEKESYVLKQLLQPHIWRELSVAERQAQITSYNIHMLEAQGKLPPNQRSELNKLLKEATERKNDPVK